jgi:hypothetical protein
MYAHTCFRARTHTDIHTHTHTHTHTYPHTSTQNRKKHIEIQHTNMIRSISHALPHVQGCGSRAVANCRGIWSSCTAPCAGSRAVVDWRETWLSCTGPCAGVRLEGGGELAGDLVVMAGGRGSALKGWLKEGGVEVATPEIVDCGLVTCGSIYKLPDSMAIEVGATYRIAITPPVR